MLRSRTIVALSVTAAFAAPGCVHQMKVRNLNEFQMTAHTAKRHTIRLAGPVAPDTTPYGEMIRDGLDKHASVKEVVLASEPHYEAQPDVDVRADVSVKYRGSGVNFPITFPGFLIFTHAWNGYVYKADIVTDLTVTPAGGEPRTRKLATTYDMRHCDFGRGFWSSSGWFLPGWGATSLLAGAFMVSYDTDATPEFSKAVHDAYGTYVANNVAEMLAETEAQPVSSTKAAEAPRVAKGAEFAVVPAADAKPAAAAVGKVGHVAVPEAGGEDDAYNESVWKEQARHSN